MTTMTCGGIDDVIEPWAAGELEPSAEAAAHVASCATCSARLARARHIDAALAQRPTTGAPPRFTSNVLRRVRQERRRPEPTLGAWSDLPLAAAATLIAVGTSLLADRSGNFTRSIETTVARLQGFLVNIGTAAATVSPYVYVAATLLLVVMLMVSESDQELA